MSSKTTAAYEARISPKNQMVLPKAIRQTLQVQAGDAVLFHVEEGGRVVLVKRPQSYTATLRGLHQDVWQDVDAPTYLEAERASWDD